MGPGLPDPQIEMGYNYETDSALFLLDPVRLRGGTVTNDGRKPILSPPASLPASSIQTEQATNPTASMADGGGGGGGEPGASAWLGAGVQTSAPPRPPARTTTTTAAAPLAALRSKKGLSSAGKLVFSSADASSERGGFQFESSRTIQSSDSRATATLETETEFDRDARAIRERQLKQAEESLKKNPSGSASASGSGAGEVYKGIHGYTDYKAGFRREHTVASEKAGGSHGPLRASAHIRLSARFDYQPDICKDYKETGYCGDYKSGWQIEKEWEEAEKARKRRIAMGGDGSDDEAADEEEDDDEEALPFACFICRQPFVDPVPTLGIFNAAQEIRKKMAQDKKQQG
ncbi:hypothetical protein HU200_046922 [Digitaria exilis]|uniref:Uncharacterized protein n=1 Tax=Digitaria exilis TaxID=1010633 RepID=A0A835EAP6_9POAL|nr:hypothetical protein HU200_046922 [Digitaria exilis]